MKILALQLKRIGDLVLTTTALSALKTAWPEAHITLAVMAGTASLLPAIAAADAGVVFGRGRGLAPWQQVWSGGWDWCFDLTGNDRSALAAVLSRAKTRVTFASVRRNKLRALAYGKFVDSPVRERHTADHYRDLVAPTGESPSDDAQPELHLPAHASAAADALLRAGGIPGPFVLLHPGTARPEKYWLADRWQEVAAHLKTAHGLLAIVTCGPDAFEQAHAAAIGVPIISPPDLLALAALVARARLVISCDTAVVHLAAAFRVPQITLFGPTNPFHWRPRHERAVVLSAAHPEAPLTQFDPRMRGAPMERISTALVIGAMAELISTS